MTVLSATILFAGCINGCDGGTPPGSDLLRIGTPNWEDPLERKLYAFCVSALLKTRGIGATLVEGSSDDWILKSLWPEREFQTALNNSEPTSMFAMPDDDGTVNRNRSKGDRETNNESILPDLQRHNLELVSALSLDQRLRLPGVYLNVEGLLAICRPEFAGLFEDPAKQKELRDLVEKYFDQKIAPIQQALFTMKAEESEEEGPIGEVYLRLLSAELDWLIVKRLTRKEQERVWDLIERSEPLKDVAHAPPFR